MDHLLSKEFPEAHDASYISLVRVTYKTNSRDRKLRRDLETRLSLKKCYFLSLFSS
jgi:hypothetical protein